MRGLYLLRAWADDPRTFIASAAVACASSYALVSVVAAMIQAAGAGRAPGLAQAPDLGPVLGATSLTAFAVTVRVHVFVGQLVARPLSLLVAAGASPSDVKTLSVLTELAPASLGALLGSALASLSVPLVTVVPQAASSGGVGGSSSFQAWLLGSVVSVACIAAVVTGTAVLGAARLLASRPPHDSRGHGGDRGETLHGELGRWISASLIWALLVAPVVFVTLAWTPLLAVIEGDGPLAPSPTDELDDLGFFTAEMRVLALHATVGLASIVALTIVMPVMASRVTRVWTRWVPDGRGLVWWLAVRQGRRRRAATTAAATSVALALGFVAFVQSSLDLASMVGVIGPLESRDGLGQSLSAIAPALVISGGGAFAVAVLTSMRDASEEAGARRHGASSASTGAVRLALAIIPVVTSLLPVLVCVGVSLGLSLALGHAIGASVHWAFPRLAPALVAGALAFAVLVAGDAAGRAAPYLSRAPRASAAKAATNEE